jgi:hypothetical protein
MANGCAFLKEAGIHQRNAQSAMQLVKAGIDEKGLGSDFEGSVRKALASLSRQQKLQDRGATSLPPMRLAKAVESSWANSMRLRVPS